MNEMKGSLSVWIDGYGFHVISWTKVYTLRRRAVNMVPFLRFEHAPSPYRKTDFGRIAVAVDFVPGPTDTLRGSNNNCNCNTGSFRGDYSTNTHTNMRTRGNLSVIDCYRPNDMNFPSHSARNSQEETVCQLLQFNEALRDGIALWCGWNNIFKYFRE